MSRTCVGARATRCPPACPHTEGQGWAQLGGGSTQGSELRPGCHDFEPPPHTHTTPCPTGGNEETFPPWVAAFRQSDWISGKEEAARGAGGV